MILTIKNSLRERNESDIYKCNDPKTGASLMLKNLQCTLQRKAASLLHDYSKLLSRPLGNRFSHQDKPCHYVDIGTWKKPGDFEPSSASKLQLDGNNRLNFVIATIQDDNCHGIDISLCYENSILYATIGSGRNSTTLLVPQVPSGFYEACKVIHHLHCTAIDIPHEQSAYYHEVGR